MPSFDFSRSFMLARPSTVMSSYILYSIILRVIAKESKREKMRMRNKEKKNRHQILNEYFSTAVLINCTIKVRLSLPEV